jgi:DNA repair photolyase
MEFKRTLVKTERKFNTWCNYTTRLDTYGCGCQHGCKYCYAKGLLNYSKLWLYNPKISNLSNIKHELSKLSAGNICRLGGMTDCFQPMEFRHRITYETIKLLNWYKIHYLIVTKSNLVASDEYINIYDKELAHFQVSISHTFDSEIEKAPKVGLRIKAIEKLQKLGFDVSVRLSPFLYQFTDINIINSIKCNKILIEFLKVNQHIRSSFNYDYSDYTLKYGGHNNLQLNQKIELVSKIKAFEQVSVGEYVREHYEYFRKSVNFNKLDCCNLNYKKPINHKMQQLKLFHVNNSPFTTD